MAWDSSCLVANAACCHRYSVHPCLCHNGATSWTNWTNLDKPEHSGSSWRSCLLQAVESQVRALNEQVAQLQAEAVQQRRQRRWLPELPETIGTRQALLGAGLLATASAATVLLWSSRARAQHQ